MKVTKLQLLNITTGVMHTNMDDIYKFFDQVIEEGIMTHMLPRALEAIRPILKERYPSLPFEGHHSKIENGSEEIEIVFTEEEKARFWGEYMLLPSPLPGSQK